MSAHGASLRPLPVFPKPKKPAYIAAALRRSGLRWPKIPRITAQIGPDAPKVERRYG
jgi:hypothetical protein